jgi:hypothetical protein
VFFSATLDLRTACQENALKVNILNQLQALYEKQEAFGADVAGVYAGLGDKDKAFEWLEKDYQARNGRLARIRWNPRSTPQRRALRRFVAPHGSRAVMSDML